MLPEVQPTRAAAPAPSVDVALPGGAPATSTPPPATLQSQPPTPGDSVAVAKAAPAAAKAAPADYPFNEKLAEIPVIGRVYTAYKLAQVALFEDVRTTPNEPPPNNGPVMTVFKTVIGVPVMTLGFLVAAALARKD
ncbi:MAG: hypothetical protein ACAI38_07370 [Myxococcota bacterium]|nr:hypothetical protein [Myxococcota bacterium]